MGKFDFETWWSKNVAPKEENIMDFVYKDIARDLLKDVLSFYKIDDTEDDIENIDLSDILSL